MARLTTAIAGQGGFLSVVVGYPGRDKDTWISVCKVKNLTIPQLEKIIGELKDIDLLDIRETSA